jgi:Icc-related predicted phosphoesterase
VKLVCISDTHGEHEQLELPDGDVLVHAGDMTAHGSESDTCNFMSWFGSRNFSHKICIAGNHDSYIEAQPGAVAEMADEAGVTLLNDSGCRVNGLYFWGSPITPRFLNWSFMRDPGSAIEAHWNLIPLCTDVLITHGPPWGILDQVQRTEHICENTGCPSLLARIHIVMPAVHLFGHIHESHGRRDLGGVSYFNVSTMDEGYRIHNKPVVVELPANKTGE